MTSPYSAGSIRPKLYIAIGIIIILLLVSVGGVFLVNTLRKDEASLAAAEFISAINRKEYDNGYSYLKEDSDPISIGTWSLWVDGIHEANARISQTPSEIKPAGSTILVNSYNTLHTINEYSNLELTLKSIDSQWYVTAFKIINKNE